MITRARELLAEALRIQREVGDRRAECNTIGHLAILEHDVGNDAHALAHFETALAHARELGNRRFEAYMLGYRAMCQQTLGRTAEAQKNLEEAISQADRFVVRPVAALFRTFLAALLADANEAKRAACLFAEADALLAGMSQPSVAAASRLLRGHLDLALARAAAAKSDAIAASEHRHAARRRLRAVSSADRAHTDVRFAHRNLSHALASEPALARGPMADGFAAEVLVIEPTGAWFRPPHGKVAVLAHRVPLRNIVAELFEQRRTCPGEPVARDVLIRRAWPSEPVGPHAINRLRVALSAVRKLGLATALLTRGGGYLLDPLVPVASPEEDA